MRPFHKLFNAGTSEGVRKGWESRRGGFPSTDVHGNQFGGLTDNDALQKAGASDSSAFSTKTKSPEEFQSHKASRDAYYASSNAFRAAGKPDEFSRHDQAEKLHAEAGRQHRARGDWESAQSHEQHAAGHATMSDNLKWEHGGKPATHWDSSD